MDLDSSTFTPNNSLDTQKKEKKKDGTYGTKLDSNLESN